MTETLFSSTTTHLTPPRLEEDKLSWLRLFRSRGVGVQTFFRLMQEHGDAARVLDLLPDLAGKAGVSNYIAASHESALAEMRAARKSGARLIFHGEERYPASLAEISDAPPLFWTVGNIDLLARPMIALVGARNASSLGERMARTLAGDLADAGYVVVSGLARGIDASAHAAALQSGTVAVLGGGVDIVYPVENKSLFEEIGALGLRVSEQPMGLAPQARHFPRRNRIISGLARGLVVVEAAARSGSLISARNALDQGREVCAVPGHPLDARASGCNILIRDGATLVRSAADIIEAIGTVSDLSRPDPAGRDHIPPPKARHTPGPDTTPPHIPSSALHGEILGRLGPAPLAEDALIRDLGISAGAIAPALVDLELDGAITRHSGGMVSLSPEGAASARH